MRELALAHGQARGSRKGTGAGSARASSSSSSCSGNSSNDSSSNGSSSSSSSSGSPGSSSSSPASSQVAVTFALGADDDCDGSGCVTVSAVKGEDLLGVAQRAGVALTLGCCSGSCGVCEVEVTVYTDGERERADDGNTSVVRTCIGRVPPGCVSAIVRDLPGDDIWGGEGGSGGVQW